MLGLRGLIFALCRSHLGTHSFVPVHPLVSDFEEFVKGSPVCGVGGPPVATGDADVLSIDGKWFIKMMDNCLDCSLGICSGEKEDEFIPSVAQRVISVTKGCGNNRSEGD